MNSSALLPVLALTAVGGFACNPDSGVASAPGPFLCSHQITLDWPMNYRNREDLLFVVDNSRRMGEKQELLRGAARNVIELLPQLLFGNSIDLHIGVVTTDLGAGRSGAPGCDAAPGGDGARIQSIGHGAPLGCKAPIGPRYLAAQIGPDGIGMNNAPPGQSVADTLDCMLAVGTSGCGFAQPLEVAYRFLHDELSVPTGFLRPESELAVVFLTDGDDASAPADTDRFDPALANLYGPDDSYHRATRAGIRCGTPPIAPPDSPSGGPLTDCAPAPNPQGMGPGRLYEVERYVDFLSHPLAGGGVERNPLDVSLVVIDGPDRPFEVILSNPATPAGAPYSTCNAPSPTCSPMLGRSCQSAVDPLLDGAPAVRLNTVARAVNHRSRSNVYSICSGDYNEALASAIPGFGITYSIGGCIPEHLADPTHPQCNMQDVTWLPDGSQQYTSVPSCADAPDAPVCFRFEASSLCTGLSPDGLRAVVDRHGAPAPDHTVTQATCAIACG